MAFSSADEAEILDIQSKLAAPTASIRERSHFSGWRSKPKREQRRARRQARAELIQRAEQSGIKVYESATGLAILWALIAPLLRPVVEEAIKRILDQIFGAE